ncbi:hypothetical protein O0L34_g10569 [Tuta absoluta]|nr:hypothetical protein O0L34_g10569 [Tuta absoluta]
MDTTEDNTETQSLYQDSHRAYGVKSPTSELARLEHRQSHNVQLMKASLYADAEMDDDASVSTEDQMVPHSLVGGSTASLPLHPPTAQHVQGEPLIEHTHTHTEEMPMKPLIVRPHTIVLKYHRKVPPFKKTVAGRLNAACIADMSVCRARHSRAGFGPASAVVYPNARNAVEHLPNTAELCDLGRYVSGRDDNDWSEQVVLRLALGQPDDKTTFLETLTHHLETLLEFSTFVPDSGEAPRLMLEASPRARREALRRLTRHYNKIPDRKVRFGVSSAYCREVFQLCEALWGADLENDGVPGMDEASIVNRHKKLLEWLTSAVHDVTEAELKKPRAPEPQDECDGHSARVWTLLLGGRVVEACRVAIENGDINMATLIAQCAGDPTFRSLIARQISIWRECGADTLISTHRLAALHLLAGLRSPRELLAQADWLRALHATAR